MTEDLVIEPAERDRGASPPWRDEPLRIRLRRNKGFRNDWDLLCKDFLDMADRKSAATILLTWLGLVNRSL